MTTARRTRESPSTFNLMKKYLHEVKEEIFYSEEEDDPVKKQQVQPAKDSESSNGLAANLRLESYGDLFLSERNKNNNQNNSTKGKVQPHIEDDYYLPEAEITSSEDCELSVEVSSSQLQKKRTPNHKRKSGRKLRTAITKEKLQEINNIFRDYHQKKENGCLSQTTLKEIGDRLHLGYSTILHKYKEFKQNKQVKGGYLLEIEGSKRKYSKSVKVQTLIREALEKVQLANAVQISKYIFKTKDIYYSRAVICRHLLAMKRNMSEQDKKIAEAQNGLQKQMQPLSFEEILLHEKKNGRVVYCHEIVFSTSERVKKIYTVDDYINQAKELSKNLTISLIFAINQNKLVYYKLKQGLIFKDQYEEVMRELATTIRQHIDDSNQKIWLAVNLNQIHYDQGKADKIEEILDGFNIQKILLSPEDLGLEPLGGLFQNIKTKIENRCKKVQSVQDAIVKELKQWMSDEQRFSF